MENNFEIKKNSEKANIHPSMETINGIRSALGLGISIKKESIDESNLFLNKLKILCCNILFKKFVKVFFLRNSRNKVRDIMNIIIIKTNKWGNLLPTKIPPIIPKSNKDI